MHSQRKVLPTELDIITHVHTHTWGIWTRQLSEFWLRVGELEDSRRGERKQRKKMKKLECSRKQEALLLAEGGWNYTAPQSLPACPQVAEPELITFMSSLKHRSKEGLRADPNQKPIFFCPRAHN